MEDGCMDAWKEVILSSRKLLVKLSLEEKN